MYIKNNIYLIQKATFKNNNLYFPEPMDSPKLKPYPSWEAHRLPRKNVSTDPPEIVSPFRIRADQCGRLWVLDTGVEDLLGDTHAYKPSQLLVYDLHNDALLRRYQIPNDQIKGDSFFATIAVEDYVCEDAYAYLGDIGSPAMVVYSWQKQKSWRVKHHYFNIDPTAGEFNVSGIAFQWTDGLFGLALSAPQNDGFSTLYFHPMVSTYEFSVNTKYLRDENLAKSSFHEFKILGDRGPKSQSGVSFVDKNTGVLFYTLLNLNAIACWKTTNPSYTMTSQGRVFMSNETMVFPNDIKVDSKGNLWVLSDRLPTFMYKELDKNDINFRILTATVEDAIRGTACDKMLKVPQNLTPRPVRPNESTRPEISSRSSAGKLTLHLTLFAATILLLFSQ